MANSPKICANKDCGMQLQPGDQFCASCGTKVPEPHAFDRKYLVAIGIGFLIIGILAGGYASKYLNDGQTPDRNDSKILDEEDKQILESAEFLKLKGDWALQKDNNITKSIYYYKKATEKDFRASEAWIAMGNLEKSKKQNYSNALECYRNADKAQPNIKDPLEMMGEASFEIAFRNNNSRDLDNASNYYDERAKTSVSALNKKSEILYNWTKHNETNEIRKFKLIENALESNNISIKVNPNESKSWQIRGDLYLWLSNHTKNEVMASDYEEEALECYKRR